MRRALQSQSFVVVFLATLCLLLTATAFAAIEGGNAKNGKHLAKEKCKYCHVAGADGGTMTPLSKTQRQWDRFYKKDKHNKMTPGSWDKISDAELKDIMQYMHDHAADSDQPETCGQ